MCIRCMGVNFGRIDLVRFGGKNSYSQFGLDGCWNLIGFFLGVTIAGKSAYLC